MADYQIGKKGDFRKYIEGLLSKSKANSQGSFLSFIKRLGQRYKNTGVPLKIMDVNQGDDSFVLEDYSRWKMAGLFKPPKWVWSRGDEVIVTGSRGGTERAEVYNIRNTSLEDEALCVFQGFVRER